jgi:hypothetical protein
MDTTVTTHVDTPYGAVEALIHDQDRVSVRAGGHGDSNENGLLIHGVRYRMNLTLQRHGGRWVWDHINGVHHMALYYALTRMDDSLRHASDAAQKGVVREVLPRVVAWIDQCPTLFETAHFQVLEEKLDTAERDLREAEAVVVARRRDRDDLLRQLGRLP